MTAPRRHPNRRARAELPVELRRSPVSGAVRAWVEHETAARVVAVRRLPGASSTAVHRLDLADGRRVVLRRYVWPGFVQSEPLAPRREVDALTFAAAHGLPVPEVVAVDLAGRATGDGVPAVLLSLVPGRPLAAPDPRALAELAVSIHAVDARAFPHHYFGWYEGVLVEPPRASRRPEVWSEALELRTTAMPSYRPVFVHRDFHPGNVLFVRSKVTGVVDWAGACSGPAGCDVAHCRANLLAWAGRAAAEAFVACYEERSGTTLDPYWLLASVLEHEPAYFTAERVRAVEPDLARAVSALAGVGPPNWKRATGRVFAPPT